MNPTTTGKVGGLRRETPGARHGMIHFNAAAGAALQPSPVLDAVKCHVEAEALLGPYEAERAAHGSLAEAHPAVAALLGCHPDEVAVLDNAVASCMSLVLTRLVRECGSIVVIDSVLAARLRGFRSLCSRLGVVVEPLPIDEATDTVNLTELRRMLADSPVKLVALPHLTESGRYNPVAEVGALAHTHGIPVLLDASLSVGQTTLDTTTLRVDFLAVDGHKYLRAPRGTGFAWLRGEWVGRLSGLAATSGIDASAGSSFAMTLGGAELHQATVDQATGHRNGSAAAFEPAEYGVAARLGLVAAVHYTLRIDLKIVRKQIRRLVAELQRLLKPIAAIDCGITPDSGVVRLRCRGVAAEMVLDGLAQRGVYLGRSQHPVWGRHVLQVGVHCYNTLDEIRELTVQLQEVLAELLVEPVPCDEDLILNDWVNVESIPSPRRESVSSVDTLPNLIAAAITEPVQLSPLAHVTLADTGCTGTPGAASASRPLSDSSGSVSPPSQQRSPIFVLGNSPSGVAIGFPGQLSHMMCSPGLPTTVRAACGFGEPGGAKAAHQPVECFLNGICCDDEDIDEDDGLWPRKSAASDSTNPAAQSSAQSVAVGRIGSARCIVGFDGHRSLSTGASRHQRADEDRECRLQCDRPVASADQGDRLVQDNRNGSSTSLGSMDSAIGLGSSPPTEGLPLKVPCFASELPI